jgi:hypothetical protein
LHLEPTGRLRHPRGVALLVCSASPPHIADVVPTQQFGGGISRFLASNLLALLDDRTSIAASVASVARK